MNLVEEIIDVYEKLNRPTLKAMLYLYEYKRATFRQLEEVVGVDAKGLEMLLNEVEPLLIVNKIKKDEGKEMESWYELSNLGKLVIVKILEVWKEMV